ncbi:Tat proofreading chaperone DmsD [Gallibacterium anatis]|uniref:Tat proofreading chaperone DmsD n=1 Tax=Gallibacterium anatis TaxID=750 RepID=UPI0039FC027F
MMEREKFVEWVKTSGYWMGMLLYFEPRHTVLKPILDALDNMDWQEGWLPALKNEDEIVALLRQRDNLPEQFQAQFIGPNALPAPPWSTVYLDEEAVIFGKPLIDLRKFMLKNDICCNVGTEEPEDQVGLMLMMAGYIANSHPKILDEYLAKYLFTWVWRYLSLLTKQTESPFYRGIGLIAEQTLSLWQMNIKCAVPKLPLYF